MPFLLQAQRNCGLYPPATIVTDKAPTFPALVIAMGVSSDLFDPASNPKAEIRPLNQMFQIAG